MKERLFMLGLLAYIWLATFFAIMFFIGPTFSPTAHASNCGAPPPGSTPTSTPFILPTGVPIK